MLVAVAAGLAYAILSSVRSPLAPKERATVEDLVGGTFALAGFGFSVALAAVAMAIALPGSRMLRDMVLDKRSPDAPSPFTDLIFLFTWTGVVQGLATAVGMVALITAGKSVLLTVDDPGGLVMGFVVVATSTYALMQLVTAMVTIHQVALLQAKHFEIDSNHGSMTGTPSGKDHTS